MDFEYRIYDNEIKIFKYKNELSKSVIIPEVIDGYPVTRISHFIFLYSNSLKYINGIKLINGVNIINDKFIYHHGFFNTIKYIIGSDYATIDNLSYEYFIGENLYNPLFNK